jgi:5-methylcytosine-specific restriction endonuclease McrA
LAALLAVAPSAFSKVSGGHGHGSTGSHGGNGARSTPRRSARSDKCGSCARNSEGKIARNPAAVREFKKTHPCPGTCKDMVVDHIVPLKRGGADIPSNMEWQTKAEAKAKDKVE